MHYKSCNIFRHNVKSTVFFRGWSTLLWQFCSKSSEWVKTLYFFFSVPKKKNTDFWNEWVSEFQLFQEKKKYNKKNTTPEKNWYQENYNFFVYISMNFFQKSELSGFEDFLGKKTTVFFFFFHVWWKKKIQLSPDLSEWVAFYFSREKKIRYLWNN